MKKSKIDRDIQAHHELGTDQSENYFKTNKDKVLSDIEKAYDKYNDALFILGCHRTAQDFVINKMQNAEINAFTHKNKRYSIIKKFSYFNLKIEKVDAEFLND